MNFEEHAGKGLLRSAGIPIPAGELAAGPDEAERIASKLGPCVVKAQVAAGKRGKAGGIKLAATPQQARAAAVEILSLRISDLPVERLLIEQQVAIAHEMYAAVLTDQASKGPLLVFSGHGGMDIEELSAEHPDKLIKVAIDIRHGPDRAALDRAIPRELPGDRNALIDLLAKLYGVYASNDAELVEINPLVATVDGQLIALDCKLVVDDSALPRRENLAKSGSPEQLTDLETKAAELGLKFIELDGNVGVLANGAGLTMTTMDAIRHYGGAPANFLEIGGESYTKAKPALELVLSNPSVKALLVNFCGAFARTDVMVDGISKAWAELQPSLPIFFTIHGTGEDEAIAMVRQRLGLEPFDVMDDAVKAAVAAAQRSATETRT